MEQQCLSYSNGLYSTVSLQVSLASEETRHVFQHHGWRTEIDLQGSRFKVSLFVT